MLLAAAGLAGAAYVYTHAPASPATSPSEYVQLTNFTDAAVAPALSPDGRMVAFIRGGEAFLSLGQIWVKLLPNGDALRLTNTTDLKYGPLFTPDGAHVRVHAGQPGRRAHGLRHLDGAGAGRRTEAVPAQRLRLELDERRTCALFRGARRRLHMGIVTASESRAGSRDVYFPAHDRAMAHFSAASPDLQNALIVQMDRTGAWEPCRLVPLDGNIGRADKSGRTAHARRVRGPLMDAGCTSAALVGGSQHLWRQAFPDGSPAQITFGATEEEGVAMAPDGRSLITSIGTSRSAVWIHDAAGERAISTEGYAYQGRVSRDGRRLFYLSRRNQRSSSAELRVADLATGASESVFPGQAVEDFDLSPDGKTVVFSTRPGRRSGSRRWIRSAPPRPLTTGADQPSFRSATEIVVRQLSGATNTLATLTVDQGRLVPFGGPIVEKSGVSPDGKWVLAAAYPPTGHDEAAMGTFAIPLDGGPARRLCRGYCFAGWSYDGRTFYIVRAMGLAADKTLSWPLAPGQSFPDLPADDLAQALSRGGPVQARSSTRSSLRGRPQRPTRSSRPTPSATCSESPFTDAEDPELPGGAGALQPRAAQTTMHGTTRSEYGEINVRRTTIGKIDVVERHVSSTTTATIVSRSHERGPARYQTATPATAITNVLGSALWLNATIQSINAESTSIRNSTSG